MRCVILALAVACAVLLGSGTAEAQGVRCPARGAVGAGTPWPVPVYSLDLDYYMRCTSCFPAPTKTPSEYEFAFPTIEMPQLRTPTPTAEVPGGGWELSANVLLGLGDDGRTWNRDASGAWDILPDGAAGSPPSHYWFENERTWWAEYLTLGPFTHDVAGFVFEVSAVVDAGAEVALWGPGPDVPWRETLTRDNWVGWQLLLNGDVQEADLFQERLCIADLEVVDCAVAGGGLYLSDFGPLVPAGREIVVGMAVTGRRVVVHSVYAIVPEGRGIPATATPTRTPSPTATGTAVPTATAMSRWLHFTTASVWGTGSGTLTAQCVDVYTCSGAWMDIPSGNWHASQTVGLNLAKSHSSGYTSVELALSGFPASGGSQYDDWATSCESTRQRTAPMLRAESGVTRRAEPGSGRWVGTEFVVNYAVESWVVPTHFEQIIRQCPSTGAPAGSYPSLRWRIYSVNGVQYPDNTLPTATPTNTPTNTPTATATLPFPTATPIPGEGDCRVIEWRGGPVQAIEAEVPSYWLREDEQCYTVVAEQQLTIPEIGLIGFPGVDLSWDGIALCPTWVKVPHITILGWRLSADLLLIPLIAFLIRELLRW